MNLARALSKIAPLLIGLVLSVSACAAGPHAGDRLHYGEWSGWRSGLVRHASGHGGRGHGLASQGDFGGRGGGGHDEHPAGNLVLLAPPPLTATYPISLGQAHGTVERYYEAHASERAGQCLAPYIDGIANSQVIENTAWRLVVDVRYLYRDRLKTDAPTSCISFGERRFVLARNGDSLDVAEMSGPRRN